MTNINKAQISIEFMAYILLILIILLTFININNHFFTKIKSQNEDSHYILKLELLTKNKLKTQNMKLIKPVENKEYEIK